MTATATHLERSAPADRRDERLTLRGHAGPVEASVVTVGPREPRTPDVVFLHGLVGLNEHWELVTDRVRDRIRCTMLELPLLELTGEDCSVDGVTRLTVQFLEQRFPGRPVVLAGNSFGGHVAMRATLARPELVAGLVLAGASGLYEKSIMSRPPHNPDRAWIRKRIAELFYLDESVRDEDVDRAHAVLGTRAGARAMVKLSRSARRDHLGRRLGNISVPSLLLWGTEDVVTPPASGRRFAEEIPESRIGWFDRCGHVPMIEAADGFAGALDDFIDDIGLRRGDAPGDGQR